MKTAVQRMWQWSAQHKKWMLALGTALGLIVGLSLWLGHVLSIRMASLSGAASFVLPNIPPLLSITKGVHTVVHLGIRQAELDQAMTKELLGIEQSQRNNISRYLETMVYSVGYKKGMVSTVPFVVIHIRFVNLLFSSLEILGCKLYTEPTDTGQINCRGSNNQIESQDIDLTGNTTHVEPASIQEIDLRIRVPEVVMQKIKEAVEEQSDVQYCLRVRWELATGHFGNHSLCSYLSSSGTPNPQLD